MIIDLVINPHAGRRRGHAAGEEARDRLIAHGYTVREHISEYPGHAVELAAAAVDAEPESDAIVAVGGDGTLFEVINGAFRSRFDLKYKPTDDQSDTSVDVNAARLRNPLPIGIIPVGTGNSFVRDIGITNTDDALDAIIRGSTRRIDLGILEERTGRYAFINLLGAGFVSNVAHRAQRYKRWGALSYVIGVIQETIALEANRITIELDGREIARDAIFVEICNSRFTGGAMMIAPDARIDDGLFDVVFMRETTRRHLLRLFPKIFSGRHTEDPIIEVHRAGTIRVKTQHPWHLTPDGETFGQTPISATNYPEAVTIFCP